MSSEDEDVDYAQGLTTDEVVDLLAEVQSLRRAHESAREQAARWNSRAATLEGERDLLRELLVFADGACVTGMGMPLADLYAEDCEWAQTTLRDAGCHPRGSNPVAL